MIHGFADPKTEAESRAFLWRAASSLLGIVSSEFTPAESGSPRVVAFRSVIGKLLDAKDHSVESPAERDALEVLLKTSLNLAKTSFDQLTRFHATLGRHARRRPAVGAESDPKPR